MFKYLSLFLILIGGGILQSCGTENPICTDNYCITGEVFPREDLGDREFTEAPGNIDENTLINLLTVDVGEYEFKPVLVTGKIDWDFQSPLWQYRQNRITYLKKVTLEIESDQGRFNENRVILIYLNKDTVEEDSNFNEHVDFLGTETIRLTHHIGIATFKGDIIGAPTK